MIIEIFTNEILIIPICSWAVAQLLKVIIILIQKKQLDLRYLVISGGMPSAHSAVVSALTTSVALTQGLGSAVFGLSAIIALIVMYDAAGVRQSVGKQSIVLNRMIRELSRRRTITDLEHDLKEFIGHTSFQVIVGGLLGVIIAWSWLAIISAR